MAYCIKRWNSFTERKYFIWMSGYEMVDYETLKLATHLSKKDHPFIFKTEEAAFEFIESSDNPYIRDSSPEYISDKYIPSCGRDCWKCNKKHKDRCKHLLNPLQYKCGFIMSSFPEDMVFDPKRLDAPCEKCLTRYCPYNMNYM